MSDSAMVERKGILPRFLATIRLRWWYFAVGLLSCAAIAVTMLDGVLPSRASSACYCGKDIDEARQRGCTFDILSSAWLPPECRDEALTAEFEAAAPDGYWQFYADKPLQEPVDMDYVLAMSGDLSSYYWVSWEFHVTHCFFLWQKQLMAREGGVIFEERFDSIGHVRHCLHVFQNRHQAAGSVTFDSAASAVVIESPLPEDAKR